MDPLLHILLRDSPSSPSATNSLKVRNDRPFDGLRPIYRSDHQIHYMTAVYITYIHTNLYIGPY